jgi:FkbM family methyltransferase
MHLRLHPRDNGCEKNLLFTPQMYEPVELRELEWAIAAARARQKPFVFVDVGANVGLFSFFVAARAGRDARILAIEPEPGNLARLYFNIRANPAAPIKAIAVALSDEAGTMAIMLDRRDRGGSRAQKVTEPAASVAAPHVPSQTLLSVLAAERIESIDALKIDVEGAEDVILGRFFGEAPPQLWPRSIIIEDSSGAWTIDVFGLLRAKGYSAAARSKQNVMWRRPDEKAQAAGVAGNVDTLQAAR